MKIKDIMTEHVEVISPSSTISEAARKMKDMNCGCLPVCENDRLVGILTDRDIVVRALAPGSDPNTTTVSNVMTKPISYCFEDDDPDRCAAIMESKQVRRLVVLDRNKRLCGIVSLGDLARKTGDEELTGEVLEEVSKPKRARAAA